jgi:hypothetical protein
MAAKVFVAATLALVVALAAGAAAERAPRPAQPALAPVLLEAQQPIQTRGCDNCDMDEVEDFVEHAAADTDMAQWPLYTTRRAKNILRMLAALDKVKTPHEHRIEQAIEEDQHLLDLAEKVKAKMLLVLGNKGVVVSLPSERPTLVDAAGNHWSEPEMKDDLDYLQNEFAKEVVKDEHALQSELDRSDIPQYAEADHMLDLINSKNPVRPRIVDKLKQQCACTCPSTACPCNCDEAVVRIGPPAPHLVEADEISCRVRRC